MECTGLWIGELVASPLDRSPLVLRIDHDGPHVRGLAGPALAALGHAHITNAAFDADTGAIRIELRSRDDAGERVTLDGSIVGNVMAGRFVFGDTGRRGTFQLARS